MKYVNWKTVETQNTLIILKDSRLMTVVYGLLMISRTGPHHGDSVSRLGSVTHILSSHLSLLLYISRAISRAPEHALRPSTTPTLYYI